MKPKEGVEVDGERGVMQGWSAGRFRPISKDQTAGRCARPTPESCFRATESEEGDFLTYFFSLSHVLSKNFIMNVTDLLEDTFMNF